MIKESILFISLTVIIFVVALLVTKEIRDCLLIIGGISALMGLYINQVKLREHFVQSRKEHRERMSKKSTHEKLTGLTLDQIKKHPRRFYPSPNHLTAEDNRRVLEGDNWDNPSSNINYDTREFIPNSWETTNFLTAQVPYGGKCDRPTLTDDKQYSFNTPFTKNPKNSESAHCNTLDRGYLRYGTHSRYDDAVGNRVYLGEKTPTTPDNIGMSIAGIKTGKAPSLINGPYNEESMSAAPSTCDCAIFGKCNCKKEGMCYYLGKCNHPLKSTTELGMSHESARKAHRMQARHKPPPPKSLDKNVSKMYVRKPSFDNTPITRKQPNKSSQPPPQLHPQPVSRPPPGLTSSTNPSGPSTAMLGYATMATAGGLTRPPFGKITKVTSPDIPNRREHFFQEGPIQIQNKKNQIAVGEYINPPDLDPPLGTWNVAGQRYYEPQHASTSSANALNHSQYMEGADPYWNIKSTHDRDPALEARRGLEEIYKEYPIYEHHRLKNANWRVQLRSKLNPMLDAKRIQESQWRSRNNKTADGLQRRLNIASFKKYFDEELADRESSLWWGI